MMPKIYLRKKEEGRRGGAFIRHRYGYYTDVITNTQHTCA